jgi:hypothetical protein
VVSAAWPARRGPSCWCCVTDATNLRLNLRLVLEVRALGLPMVLVILAAVMLLMFQAVFAWAEWPMSMIEAGTLWLGEALSAALPEGALRGLLVDGIIAGVGGVMVFLPQILILFFFILALEDPATCRARPSCSIASWARSACPGVPSSRCCRASPARFPASWPRAPSSHWRDRWLTILIAPLMTCSARLPVYALLIAPSSRIAPWPACSTCRAWCCSRSTSPALSARRAWPAYSSTRWGAACTTR